MVLSDRYYCQCVETYAVFVCAGRFLLFRRFLRHVDSRMVGHCVRRKSSRRPNIIGMYRRRGPNPPLPRDPGWVVQLVEVEDVGKWAGDRNNNGRKKI